MISIPVRQKRSALFDTDLLLFWDHSIKNSTYMNYNKAKDGYVILDSWRQLPQNGKVNASKSKPNNTFIDLIATILLEYIHICMYHQLNPFWNWKSKASIKLRRSHIRKTLSYSWWGFELNLCKTTFVSFTQMESICFGNFLQMI